MQSYNEARKNIKKKKTNIKSDSKKFKGVGSTYEAAQKVSKPKKTVVKKKETVTTTNGSSTSNLAKLRNRAEAQGAATRLYSAVKSGGERHRKQEKGRADRRAEVKNIPFGMRTVAGKAMLDDAGKAELAKRKARRQSVIRERSPVTKKDLPPPRVTDPVKLKKLSSAIAQTKQAEEAARLKREKDDLFVEKTGGKLSRKKGGTVSRKAGGTVWNGNSEVSKYYDI